MHLLTIDNLTKHYGEKVLFNDVSLSLSSADRIGIVGVNGSGKTTLLNMIAGLDAPDGGAISPNPQARFDYLPQNPVMDDDIMALDYLFASQSPTMQLLREYQRVVQMLADQPNSRQQQARMDAVNQRMDAEKGWAAEAQAKAILTKLGITEFNTRLGRLSGGQRRRVALARALLDPADLLILDEPTNHIDPETIIWLETWLGQLKTGLLMVTHDRYFLDRVVNHIFEIDAGKIYNHAGNYSLFLEHKAQRDAQRHKQAANRRSYVQKELAWLHRSPMARTGKQKARIQRAESALKEQQAAPKAGGPLTISVAARRTGKKLINLKAVSKSFGGKKIIHNFSYSANKGARLGIVGSNGAGKTTLLNLIAGRLAPDSGSVIVGQTIRIGYYDQESRALDETRRVIETITDVASVITTADGQQVTAAQMLERFQFSRKVQWGYISTLSGGERRRLYLLRTLMPAPNVLLLDEPTNDLDIQTLSILEDYLETYDGILAVVSHDRYFLDRTVEHIFAFEGEGHINQYPGNYSAYIEKKRAAPPPKATESALKPPQKPKPANNASKKLSFKERRELDELETRIAKLEAEKDALAEQINQAGADYQRLQALSAQLASIETTLEADMERWLTLFDLA